MRSVALECRFRQAEGATVGANFYQCDFDNADDRDTDDHADDTLQLAADDNGKKDQQRMQVGNPGDENRDQDKVVDQDLSDEDIEDDDPPELPASAEVYKGNQNTGHHTDDRPDIGNQVGDAGENAEHWRVAYVGEGEPCGDDRPDQVIR